MPINESQGYHLHSNLTPKEQSDAMENLYGLGGNVSPTTEQAEPTFEDLERMRRLLDRFDSKQSAGRKEFDLAKPPVPAYQYRAYPMLMYHHATRKTQPARNNDEQTALLAQGWSVDPFPAETLPPPELTGQERIEAGRLDLLLKMAPEEFDALVARSQAPMQAEQPKRKKEL